MKYSENFEASKPSKCAYIDGLENLISARQEELSKKRADYCRNIFNDAESYRSDLRKMLGWPLVDHSHEGLPAVKSVKLSDEDGFSIYRMHFEILDGVEMSGLYFEMHTEEKKPLVLVQHGGLGTPELIAGVYGYTANYNQMLERVIAQGVHAFAPQLLLWDKEYEVPFEREKIDARLKRVGSSITAVELYGMMRILDYFEVKDNISTIGMVGLSYGGFYTLFLSALDTRIKSAISCAFFNTRDKQPWSDWVWFESAGKFDDAEIACMVYPRKLCIEIADNDALFDVSYGKQAFERIKEMAGDIGTDWLDFIVFEGKHEFCKDDAPIENMVKNL